MTQTLPTLALRRTKELLVLNISHCTSEFVASLTQYNIDAFDGVHAYRQLVKLQTVSKQSDVPYAIICDYPALAKNDFAFVRAFRKNLLTAHIPIIAIAAQKDMIDPMAL